MFPTNSAFPCTVINSAFLKGTLLVKPVWICTQLVYGTDIPRRALLVQRSKGLSNTSARQRLRNLRLFLRWRMLPTEANAGHVAPQRKTLLLGCTEGPGSCQSSQWGVDQGPGEGPPPPWQLPGQLGRQRLGAEPQYALLTLSSSERAFHLTWQRRKVLYFPLSHGACQPQGCGSRFLLPSLTPTP